MQTISLKELLPLADQPNILKALIVAHRHLAELKGIAKTIPNQAILLSTLSLQEAQDSSAFIALMMTAFISSPLMVTMKINHLFPT